MIALFNSNKNFIGFCEDFPEQNNLNFFKIEVPEKYADPTKYTWIGDFYNGEFIEIEKASYIKSQEEMMENIIKKYPIQVQIINIIKQLNTLSNKEKIYDYNFKEMSNEILNIWK
jgi:hypothetical protein